MTATLSSLDHLRAINLVTRGDVPLTEETIDLIDGTTRDKFFEWSGIEPQIPQMDPEVNGQGKIFFFQINYGKPVSPTGSILNFGFDHAAKCTTEQAIIIGRKIEAWRKKEATTATLDAYYEEIEKYDHFTALWV